MKVVFFRHSLLSRGGDKMVLAHAGYLAACGPQVVIVSNVLNTVLDIPIGVSIEMLSRRGKFGTIISTLAQRIEAEVIVSDIIAMSLLLSLRNAGRVVYYAQDYDESYYTSRFMKGLVRLFYLLGLRYFRIPTIAVSEPLAELLRNRFNASVKVAENGVDTKVFYPDPDPELVKAKEGRKAILLLSRSDRRKGFDIARDVINSMSKSHPGASEVWTVGEPCTDIFTGVIHRDFGYVAELELRRIMSSADIFLYPTRHEGFGLMPLEAFACKCPVVTTMSVPYAVDGKNSFVTAIVDTDALYKSVVKLIEDPLLADEIVFNGALCAKESSLEMASVKFAGFLEGFLCH